jgi:nucleoid-associated protein YgaU
MAFLLASMLLLGGMGTGRLGGPPLLRPASLEAWIGRAVESGPSPAVGAGFALLRLLALALGAYLLVLTLASLLTHAAGWSRAARLADRRSPRVVSMVVRSSLGLTLTANIATAAAIGGTAPAVAVASSAAHLRPATASDRVHRPRLPATTEAERPRRPAATPGRGPALEWVARGTQRPPASAASQPHANVAPRAPSGQQVSPPQVPATHLPATWTVQPGESFWSIAAAVLQEAWGRAPTDAEIGPYWLSLIAANRQALLHPDLPDLIYAGQVFVVPHPPTPDTGG